MTLENTTEAIEIGETKNQDSVNSEKQGIMKFYERHLTSGDTHYFHECLEEEREERHPTEWLDQAINNVTKDNYKLAEKICDYTGFSFRGFDNLWLEMHKKAC